jgi:adenine phosphoribosyltransferase
MNTLASELMQHVRAIPDFPSSGILFRDITPLLQNGEVFRKTVEALAERYRQCRPDSIAAIESRGLILGAAVAYELSVGVVPVRKQGKLPYKTYRVEYALEYGTSVLEIHQDAVRAGERVLIVDDLLATGGTIAAAIQLVERCGASVMGVACLIELVGLKGRERLQPYEIETLLRV